MLHRRRPSPDRLGRRPSLCTHSAIPLPAVKPLCHLFNMTDNEHDRLLAKFKRDLEVGKTDEMVAYALQESNAGEVAGRRWADQAAILDLERIRRAMGRYDCSQCALTEGLRMTVEEVTDCCFDGRPQTHAFADGFVAACIAYLEESSEEVTR
jgi:hypothetical protein